jgi:4-hydroxy-3-polyprenylbenzoate decarboxylase
VPYDTLQDYLKALEARGELRRISAPVDPVLEATEFADRAVKSGGPALLFEHPVGSDFPLAMNLFGTWERTKLALGGVDPETLARELEELLHLSPPSSLLGKLKMLPRLAGIAGWAPKLVKSGPCKEVIVKENPDLLELPIQQCWPGDGGRFITLPLVVTKHPETGNRNVGMYRMHVYDGRTTGMHWHLHRVGAHHYRLHEKLGRRMPVAVALGADPAMIYAATAPLPEDFDEYLFAGFLRKRALELVKCETVDLEAPAGSEFVLEGYVEPGERRSEGPFGDHTGYYSPADDYPVFHLTGLTRRREPVYPATIVGRPPMEDCWLAKVTERLFLPLIKIQLPEIVDLNLPVEGIFHNLALVSIRKSYPGQAYKVMHGLWGLGQMMFAKIIVVLDEEANVQDLSEVIWRLGNHIDPERDICFVRGPVDVLNHASPRPSFGTKMGIDATRKWPEEGFSRPWPEEIKMTPEIKQRVEQLWRELGLP